MQLSDKSIFKALKNGKLVIVGLDNRYPFEPQSQVQPASIDLRLGNRFVRYSKQINELDIKDREKLKQYEIVEYINDGNGVVLNPNEVLHAQVYEHIAIDDGVSAKIEGRSRIARLGISVHCTGDFINPGFIGAMPLQLINHNSFPVILYPYMGICQMMLFKLTEEPLIKYGDRSRLPGNIYYNEEVPGCSIASADPLDGMMHKGTIIEQKILGIIENYNKEIEYSVHKETNVNDKSANITIINDIGAKSLVDQYINKIEQGGIAMSGDTYKAKQVGNMGGHAGKNSTVNMHYYETDSGEQIDFGALVSEIVKLKTYYQAEPDSIQNQIIVGKLAEAQVAAKGSKKDAVLVALKFLGKEVYDIAKRIGCTLLAAVIKEVMQMP